MIYEHCARKTKAQRARLARTLRRTRLLLRAVPGRTFRKKMRRRAEYHAARRIFSESLPLVMWAMRNIPYVVRVRENALVQAMTRRLMRDGRWPGAVHERH